MREMIKRFRPLLAAFLLVLTPLTVTTRLVHAVANGNNGTLKVHEIGTVSGFEDNDPKVCAFNFEGFGFDASQSGYINIDGQGQTTTNYDNQFAFGPTDGSGYAISEDFNNGGSTFTIANGQYKATLYGKDTGGDIDLTDEKAKSKVFKVECDEGQTEQTTVTATAPTFTELCGTANDTFTIPTTTGVDYLVSGQTKAANTYAGTGTVTVVAQAQSGFTLAGTTGWSHIFTDVSCGGVLGDSVKVVKPGDPDPTFTDPTCSTPGTYSVIAAEGVVYKDSNGNVVDAGTYTATPGSTVTITAYPESDAYEFREGAQTVWTHTFSTPSCGQVLGDSTTGGSGGGTPQVLGATLVNTGTPAALSIAIGVLLVVPAIVLSLRKPRKLGVKHIDVQFL